MERNIRGALWAARAVLRWGLRIDPRATRRALTVLLTTLFLVAACGSRTGVLFEEGPGSDAGLDGEPPDGELSDRTIGEAGEDGEPPPIDASFEITPMCTRRTCLSQNWDCGVNGDGCGGELQCGTCQLPLTCGGSGTPGTCGGGCTGLCQQQVQCESGTTSITGKIVTGTLPQYGAPDPVYNALVYVPNGTVEPFKAGVTCAQCGTDVSGDPLVATNTAPDGTFTLTNMPVGTNIPLVVQLGRWRRQVVIPSVTACTNTAVSPDLTRLPRNSTEGDIPATAIATGLVDSLECVVLKMGVDASEFTLAADGGRIQMYQSNGAVLTSGSEPAEDFWGNQARLDTYDQVILPCEGSLIPKSTGDQQNMISFANAGGRIFATHWSYSWLYNDAPFSGTANFNLDALDGWDEEKGFVDTSFTGGQTFLQWLQAVGAVKAGQTGFELQTTRDDVSSVNAPSEQYMFGDGTSAERAHHTLQYDFFTPVGQPQSTQCGRVTYSDFHVLYRPPDAGAAVFPAECPPGPMTSQEKALEFMILNLASCVPSGPGVCVPRTCADQGFNCGPAGDGCGNMLECGACTSPQTCGGGGTESVCGYPDAGSCTPQTCATLGYNCGINGDGCGGMIDCGTCTAPAICGGGGKPSVCGI